MILGSSKAAFGNSVFATHTIITNNEIPHVLPPFEVKETVISFQVRKP